MCDAEHDVPWCPFMKEQTTPPTIDSMIHELHAAGWRERTGNGATVWQDPNGRLHRGPADAHRTMKATERTRDAAACARVVAAAPDLLAALKWLLFEVERERDYAHWQAVIDPARAAIAKAEGQ